MADYQYKPEEFEFQPQVQVPEYQHQYDMPQQDASTSLDELDKLEQIDLLNRHSDDFAKTIATDNPYPNVMKQPLYTKVVPEGGIIKPYNTNNKRTQGMSDEANLQPQIKSNLGDLTLKNFSTKIATSLIDIINDLLCFRWGQDNFVSIFTKNDRLLSIGVLLIVVSVFFIFFKQTSLPLEK